MLRLDKSLEPHYLLYDALHRFSVFSIRALIVFVLLDKASQ